MIAGLRSAMRGAFIMGKRKRMIDLEMGNMIMPARMFFSAECMLHKACYA